MQDSKSSPEPQPETQSHNASHLPSTQRLPNNQPAEAPHPEVKSEAAGPRLAVADWTPDRESGPVGGEAGLRAGCTPPPRAHRTSSTEDTTESDSEKDAAEVYISRKSRLAPGENMHGKEANLPQKRSAAGGRSSPAKMRCPEARVKLGAATVEESEAIAALEDFRSAGSSGLSVRSSNKAPQLNPAPPTTAALAGQPVATMQDLARLLQRQQHQQAEHSPGRLQQSPFQGHPVSPTARLEDKEAAPNMRSCFSESSAERLGAIDKKDGSALALLQSILATNNHFLRQASHSSSPGKPGFSLDDAMAALKQAGAGMGLGNASMPSSPYSSSMASDHAADLGALLGLKTAAPACFARQESVGGKKPSSSGATTPADLRQPLLGGFGSLIFPGGADGPAPGQASGPLPARASEPTLRQPSASLPDAAGVLQVSTSQPGFSPPKRLSSREFPRTGGPSAPCPPPMAGPGMLDPRILDWVLGNRGSLTERSKGLDPVGGRDGKDAERLLPRVSFDGQHPMQQAPDPSPVASNTQPPSTLRRPVPVRARKEAMSSLPMDANMDLLLARLHAFSAPTSLVPPTAPGMPLPAAVPPPGMPVVAGDMQRVMQWAGTELSLRDRKVREVERQRMEERAAHENTMGMVAAEVSRLKFGQAELVKAHRQYQAELGQKDQLLEERNQLIARLSKGLAESMMQCKTAAQENESLRRDIAQLNARLAQHQPAAPQVDIQPPPGAATGDAQPGGDRGPKETPDIE